jgi:hypothetical protein
MRQRIGLLTTVGVAATLGGGFAFVARADPDAIAAHQAAMAVVALVGLLLIEVGVMVRGFAKPDAGDSDL